jgi:T-complex protein 1 subunit beta
LGGEIVSTFDAPESVRLGECKSIEEVMIGEDKLLKVSFTGAYGKGWP